MCTHTCTHAIILLSARCHTHKCIEFKKLSLQTYRIKYRPTYYTTLVAMSKKYRVYPLCAPTPHTFYPTLCTPYLTPPCLAPPILHPILRAPILCAPHFAPQNFVLPYFAPHTLCPNIL